MITASCSNCHANFNLKDEFAGKNAKCPNCQTIFSIPVKEESGTGVDVIKANESTPVDNPVKEEIIQDSQSSIAHEQGVFKNHLYWVKQKRIAINEKYYIKNTENSDIFFSIRRLYFWKRMGAILWWIAVFVISFMIMAQFISDDMAIVWMALAFIMAIIAIVYLSPKRHIEFFFSEQDADNKAPEFVVSQDKKIEFPNQNYTLRDASGSTVAKFRKNIFTDILRKTWHIEFAWKHIIIKEDSIILGLLRRLLPYGEFIRTNFIFLDVTHDLKSSQIIGYFKRKYELFDNYSLDMTNDPTYIVPRQLALCIAILLDTGEKR